MKIYFPSYYDEFKCIADRCRHSCCVGWEIDVDEKTIEKYNCLSDELGEEIRSHISNDGIIGLCENGNCPFLDRKGLCRIISHLGESFVSVICREHPRFYHTVRGRTEGGIGAACEEACRIILSSDGYYRFIEGEGEVDSPDETEFNTLVHRKYIYDLCYLDDLLTYDEILYSLREKYALPNFRFYAQEWNEILGGIEYLDKSREGSLRIGEKADRKAKDYLVRFFAYLVFRHVSVATNYDNMRARIAFSILLTAILENMIAKENPTFEEIVEFARVISEEIEYSEDNIASLVLEIESKI